MRTVRVLFALACLGALAACSSSPGKMSFGWGEDTPPASAEITGSSAGLTPIPISPSRTRCSGGDSGDDLTLGKRHYREQNYGLAEQHFRRAVEKMPRDGEAWLGLAASYDRLRRYELADRAYREALSISGPRSEVINNIGYSYLLRGDLRRARQKFVEARAQGSGKSDDRQQYGAARRGRAPAQKGLN